MKGIKKGHIIVWGKWITFNEELQKVIGCLELDDEFFKVQMDEPNIEENEATLCKKDQIVEWNRDKHDNLLNFCVNALLPKYLLLLKLVCCRLMPSSHISNVTIERAQELMAIAHKKKISLGNCIYDWMQEVFRLSKGLWFPALIIKTCHEVGG